MRLREGMDITWRQMARGALLICFTLIITLGPGRADASEVTVDECVGAHEEAQVAQAQGKLLEARKILLTCSNENCPSVVRSDCANWYTRNNSDIPSLIFTARKGENDILEAKIFINGELLPDALDGREKEFNPGRYSVKIEMEGEEPQEKQILVSKGQRERVVLFTFKVPEEELPPGMIMGPGQIPIEKPIPMHRPLQPITLILAGGAVASVGVGVLFGVLGKQQLEKFKQPPPEGCAPYCAEDKKGKVDQKFLIADIAFGTGVLLAIASVVSYAVRPEVPLEEEEEPLDGEEGDEGDAEEAAEEARLGYQRDKRFIQSSQFSMTGGPAAAGVVWGGTF